MERITAEARWIMPPTSLLFLLGTAASALTIGGIVGFLSINTIGIMLGALLMTFILFVRENELAASFTMVASICLDWYLGTHFVALGVVSVLLLTFYMARSSEHPWVAPRPFWLWVLFLGICIFPAIKGATDSYDLEYYYPNLILASFAVFWLGSVVAHDLKSLRKLLVIVSIIATLIALHVIIEGVTGKLLFATPNVENFLQSKSNYHLFGSDNVYRIGSFFIQPDAASAFLAMMIFIPLGLFVESTSILKKGFYLVETAILIVALLFTYSTAGFLAVLAGIITFMFLTGSIRHSLLMLLSIGGVVSVALFLFSSQITLLLVHATNPNDLILRQGLWETAWRMILAFPLSGIGFSRLAYQVRSEYFRVSTATTSINNPHNSYLELGALGGIPVLLLFIALLAICLWYAFCNWKSVDGRKRALFGAGIASMIVLIFNSLSFGVLTLPPLAVSGWLILGAISSPLLNRKVDQSKAQDKQM